MTSDSTNQISAGLPDITGQVNQQHSPHNQGTYGKSGVFNGSTFSTISGWSDSGSWNRYYISCLDFKASNSNSIYGNSTTVQPPAYKVYAWRRTA